MSFWNTWAGKLLSPAKTAVDAVGASAKVTATELAKSGKDLAKGNVGAALGDVGTAIGRGAEVGLGATVETIPALNAFGFGKSLIDNGTMGGLDARDEALLGSLTQGSKMTSTAALAIMGGGALSGVFGGGSSPANPGPPSQFNPPPTPTFNPPAPGGFTRTLGSQARSSFGGS